MPSPPKLGEGLLAGDHCGVLAPNDPAHSLAEADRRRGDHVEIKNSVTSTRLYQNLTAEVPLMAFYDVKNAKLCTIFEGEGSHHPAALTFNHARLKRSPPTPSFNHPG